MKILKNLVVVTTFLLSSGVMANNMPTQASTQAPVTSTSIGTQNPISSLMSAFSIPLFTSDSSQPVGKIVLSAYLTDGRGSFSGMAPQSGAPFPIPTKVDDVRVCFKATLIVEGLALGEGGRPKVDLWFSFGGNYQPVSWDANNGFVMSYDVSKLGAGMHTFSFRMRFNAGRAHRQILGDGIPFLSPMFTFSRDAGGVANASFTLPFCENEEQLKGWDDIVLWQIRTSSAIMQGTPGSAGGIVPLRTSDRLSKMLLANFQGPQQSELTTKQSTVKTDTSVSTQADTGTGPIFPTPPQGKVGEKADEKPTPKPEEKPTPKEIDPFTVESYSSEDGKPRIRIRSGSEVMVILTYEDGHSSSREIDGHKLVAVNFSTNQITKVTLTWTNSLGESRSKKFSVTEIASMGRKDK